MKSYITAILTACCLTAAAQDPGFMNVTIAGTESQFTVSDISAVTFGDTDMTVRLNDETTCIFANADAWKITFTDTQSGGVTSIFAIDSDSPVTVYDINGLQVGKAASLDQLDINKLPAGVYIIRSGASSQKITNRK